MPTSIKLRLLLENGTVVLVCLGFMILWFYQEYGTLVLAIIEASTITADPRSLPEEIWSGILPPVRHQDLHLASRRSMHFGDLRKGLMLTEAENRIGGARVPSF